MLRYSVVRHAAATCLYKKVGRKRWGCKAHPKCWKLNIKWQNSSGKTLEAEANRLDIDKNVKVNL